MSYTPKQIRLHPGSRGFVAIVVNAQWRQRIRLIVKQPGGQEIAGATFEGQGERVHARNIIDNRPHWSFGPFHYEAIVEVAISHARGGSFEPSKMVGPLSIDKMPEPDYPMQFHQSTVVSEDDPVHDNSHDDCTVTVLEYK